MSKAQLTASRREIRKAVGPRVVDVVADAALDGRAFKRFYARGFWSRLAWILFGK